MDKNSMNNVISAILKSESRDTIAESIKNYIHYRSEPIPSDLLQMVWLHAVNGLLLTDGDGTIIAVNPSLCAMASMNEATLIGRPFPVLYDEVVDHRQLIDSYRTHVRERNFAPVEERIVLFQSGQISLVEITTSVFVDGAEEVFVLQEFSDIALRKEEANKILALGRQLQIQSQEIQRLISEHIAQAVNK